MSPLSAEKEKPEEGAAGSSEKAGKVRFVQFNRKSAFFRTPNLGPRPREQPGLPAQRVKGRGKLSIISILLVGHSGEQPANGATGQLVSGWMVLPALALFSLLL